MEPTERRAHAFDSGRPPSRRYLREGFFLFSAVVLPCIRKPNALQ
jgi:hypothetical protein